MKRYHSKQIKLIIYIHTYFDIRAVYQDGPSFMGCKLRFGTPNVPGVSKSQTYDISDNTTNILTLIKRQEKTPI
jgi:hypothetical protein